jgi:hypothetical protein
MFAARGFVMPTDDGNNSKTWDPQSNNVAELLKEGERLAQQGQRESAYERSLRATNLAPRDPMAWYLRSRVSNSLEEQIFCLSRVFALEPDFPHGRQKMQAALRGLLDRDPSLAYLAETDEHYQVKSRQDILIQIPKNRSPSIPYPQREPGPTRPAMRWFNAAVLGFLLGGVGAFILAPIAVYRATQIQFQKLERHDRVRLAVIIALSILIWLASLPLVILFAIHFFG